MGLCERTADFDPTMTEMVYLHPGELVLATSPTAVTTILGSCVSVCLWEPALRIGGMNHYLLPEGAAESARSPRYGDRAMEALLEGLVSCGARPHSLRARVFGGARILDAFSGGETHLGARNVDVALRYLAVAGIPVVEKAVCGRRGYKVRFLTHEGTATVTTLRMSHGE